jgi:hypothetical protein
MVAPTYQDVVNGSFPTDAWALVEASGTDFAPYSGITHLTGVGVDLWQQAGPFPLGFSLHVTHGKITCGLTLFHGGFWCQEAWFKPDTSSSASNRLLLELGHDLTGPGSALYLPAASNVLQFLGGGISAGLGFTLPTASWTLLQWGNLAGVTGEVDVAINGQLVFTTPTSGFTGVNGIGWGGDPVNASAYIGSIAWPAFYTSEELFQQWHSRWVASTDPVAGEALSLIGPTITAAAVAANSALLALIYAAVHRTIP